MIKNYLCDVNRGTIMELRNVRTFLRVAELLSFSRAARQLNYTQSAVTIQIRQLEAELGLSLFDRVGKKINLTVDGEAFMPYAQDVIRAVDAAQAFNREPDTPRGSLRIGTVESLCTSLLPDVLEELHNACPLVETVVRTGPINQLVDMMNRNELDILYILDKKLNHHSWMKPTEHPVDIVFVVSSRHPLAGAEKASIRSIIHEPFILTEQGVNYRHELEQRLAGKGFSITPYLDIENTEIIIKLLRGATNVSFLPLFAVREQIAQGELSIVEVTDIRIKMWKQLIHHAKKTVTPQMRFFIEQINRRHLDEK